METNAAVSRALPVEPVNRDTLQERVYSQLAGLILDGDIAPGQLVTIQGLAEAFDVSTMPVREALKRLTAANALTIVSGRSIGIPPLTLERLTDLRNVRLQLEGTAAAWAAAAIGPSAIAEIDVQLGRLEQSTANSDVRSYLRANRAFHFAVYRASKSPTMVSLIEILWLQISPYFNLLRESGNYFSSNVHHRSIVDALISRDAAAARAAINGDIEGAFSILSNLLS